MKFEKFLKSVGTHGEVIACTESEKWLVCDGVGMVIPRGVDNLLGTASEREYASIVDVISTADLDDPLTLTRAILPRADGKASDIYRVFTTDSGLDEIGITNADFGLLEKSDYNLAEVEVDCEDNGYLDDTKFLLILDNGDEVVGFIEGVRNV